MNKVITALALSLFASTANAQAMDVTQMPCGAFLTFYHKPELLTPETVIALRGTVSALVALSKGGEASVVQTIYIACSQDPTRKVGEMIFKAYR